MMSTTQIERRFRSGRVAFWVATSLLAWMVLSVIPAMAQVRPPNDNFTNRTILFGDQGSVSGTTFNATSELGEPITYNGTNTVWFEWTPSTPGYATIDTFGTYWDTVLNVYYSFNTNFQSMILVARNDDVYGGYGLQSLVNFPASPYQHYYVVLSGFSSSYVGPYTLNWSLSGTTTNVIVETNQFWFASTNYTANENTPGYATVSVLYTGGAVGPVSVSYATSNGSALASIDYIASSGVLTFQPGESNKTFTIPIIDNSVPNTNKTVNLRIFNPTGGATLGTYRTAQLTIVDDETRPFVSSAGVFQFSSPVYQITANENYAGSLWDTLALNGNEYRNVDGALITVIRTNGATGRVLIDYYTTNKFFSVNNPYNNIYGYGILPYYYSGLYYYNYSYVYIPALPITIASEIYDYTPVSGTLVFDDYQMSTNFIVPTLYSYSIGLLNSNYNKLVNLVLSNPRPAPGEDPALIKPTLGGLSNSTLYITETDYSVQRAFNFERAHHRMDEYGPGHTGDNNLTVRVILTGPGGGSVQVNMYNAYGYYMDAGSDIADASLRSTPNTLFTDGSPPVRNPQDYDNQSITLTFGQDQTVATFTIKAYNDRVCEFNEDIRLWLRALPNNPPIGPQRECSATILYDDPPAGALDREWNPDGVSYSTPRYNTVPGADGQVMAVAVQPDQKTIIGGEFTHYNSVLRKYVARLHKNGFLDTTFNPGGGANGFITTIALYPLAATNSIIANRDKVLIAGGFSSFDSVQRNGIARLNSNGSLDTTFNPGNGFNGSVRSMAIQSDGKILVSGSFTMFNGTPRNHVARLNENGTLDLTFNPGDGADDNVYSIAVSDIAQTIFSPRVAEGNEVEDRNVVETGATRGVLTINYDFLTIPDNIRVYYDGVRLADVTASGPNTMTIPYGPGVSTSLEIVMNEGQGIPGTAWSYTAYVTPFLTERKIYIGGDFFFYDGQIRTGVARLNEDGSLDAAFDPGRGANSTVYAVTPQADGRLLVGGDFNDFDYRARNRIVRLDAAGRVDETFAPGVGFDNTVYSIVLQPDGKAMVGGKFSSYNYTRRMGLARLHTSGTLDTGFLDSGYNQFAGLCKTYSYEPQGFVKSIALETNGNVMIGGSFTNVGGNAAMEVVDQYAQSFGRSGYPLWTRADKRTRYNVARLIGGWDTIDISVTVGTNTTIVAVPNGPNGPGNVEFLSPEYTIDEAASFLSMPMQRVDGRLGTVFATVAATNRLAVKNVDFAISNSVPTWNQGVYAAPEGVGYVGLVDLPVSIFDNNRITGDQTFDLGCIYPQGQIWLGGEYIPLGAALGRDFAKVTIADDDTSPGVLDFSAPAYTVNENGVLGVVTVVRTNGTAGTIAVDYFTVNGSATAPADYTAKKGTLTFNSGETEQKIRIQIINDTEVELDEYLTMVLTNVVGGGKLTGGSVYSDARTTLTIIDDDFPSGRLNFSAATYTTNEGAAFAQIFVNRSGGGKGMLTAQCSATSDPSIPGQAIPGVDYIPITNTLTWTDGDTAPKVFLVPLRHESPALVEGNQTIELRLYGVSNGIQAVPDALGNLNVAELTLTDIDAYGTFSFSMPEFVTDENGTNAIITVVRKDGIVGAISVQYATGDGTAVAGRDYVGIGGTLQFAPGQLSATFSVPIIDNRVSDGDRSANLFLSYPLGGATLGSLASARLLIIDDESSAIPAGSLDTTFNEENSIGADNPVYALAVQSDGSLIMAGDFTRVNNVPRNSIARMLPNASLDPQFNAGNGPNLPIRALALQDNGRLLVGGMFTTISSTNRNHIARLNTDGSVDSSFDPGAGTDNPVYAIVVQPDGRILLGGSFVTFNSTSRPNVVRLNTNGTINAEFNTGVGPNGVVYAIALQNDGKILIGGDFTSVNNTNRNRIARLNADGSLDATFDPGTGADSPIHSIVVQSDGCILVGGSFVSINGIARNYLARLHPDGSLDANYLGDQLGADSSVLVLKLQSDGKLLVAGNFTHFNGVNRNRITRLNTDGTSDPSINFGSGADGFIAALAIQPDRKIVIGGDFTTVQDRARKRIARLHGGSIAGSGTLSFSQSLFTGYEGEDYAVINVRRSGGTFGAVSVNYQTSDNTGIAGLDYISTNGVLYFPQCETFQSFQVPLTNNSVVVDSVLVDLTLSNPTGGATLGGIPDAKLKIVGNDSLVTFQDAAYSVNENVQSGFATITLTRSGATNTVVSVTLSTSTNKSTATVDLDYSPVSSLVSFAVGETIKIVFIPIIDDKLVEGNETVTMVLSNASPNCAIGQAVEQLTIVDDDYAIGEFRFSAPEYTVNENKTNAVITVVRTNGSSGMVSVRYSASAGTAVAGLDFTTVQGTMSFAEGELTKQFLIPIINNTIKQPDRTVLLNLSQATTATKLGDLTNAVLTIIDDDFTSVQYFRFVTTNNIATPSQTNALIYVARMGAPVGTVSVGFSSQDGTALAGQDYVATNGFLVWTNGEDAPKPIVITLLDDRYGDPDENLRLILSNPSAGTVIERGEANLTIISETVGIRFSTNSYVIGENGVNALITVIRQGPTNNLLSVDYATASDLTGANPATAGLDYTPVSGTLRWALNDLAPKTFLVPILDNNVFNPDRTFRVQLSNFAGTNIVSILTNIVVGNSNYIVLTNVARVANNVFGGTWLDGTLGTNSLVTITNDDRVAPDTGITDASFNGVWGANSNVHSVAFAAGQQLYIGGDFTAVGGLAQGHIARVTTNATVDQTFATGSGFNGAVHAVLTNANEVIVGGDFTTYNGAAAGRIAILANDGSPSTVFLPTTGANGAVRALALTSLPTQPFATNSVSIGSNSVTHDIQIPGNSGNIAFTYSFFPAVQTGTNAAPFVTNVLSVIYDALVVYQTNIVVQSNTVTGSASVAFGPGAGTFVTVAVNQTITNGSAFSYAGVVTVGSETNRLILAGGDFQVVNGAFQSRLARFNRDGTLDRSFNIGTGPNGSVRALAVQSDNLILAGGDFTTVDNALANRLVRLNQDGSTEDQFRVNTGFGADGTVRSIAIQNDGLILVAGDFTNFNGYFSPHVVRLQPNGKVDATFDPGVGANGSIRSVAVQQDGKILIAGDFTSVGGNSLSRIARLLPNGQMDPTFILGAGANALVESLAVQEGLSTPVDLSQQRSGNYLENRLSVDSGGTNGVVEIDFNFQLQPNDIRVYYDGLLIYEAFTNGVGHITVPYGPGASTLVTVVMNEGGGFYVDAQWSYTLNVIASGVADQRIAVGGAFTKVNELPKGRFAVLRGSGAVYVPFDSASKANLAVYSIGLYTNVSLPSLLGKFVVGGDFTAIVGVEQNHLARLNMDGSVDTNFSVGLGPDQSVRALALQQFDGKVIIGGAFTTVNGSSRPYLARLMTNGVIDDYFNIGVGPNNAVNALALQPDGKIILGGIFTKVYNANNVGIARVNANGTVDSGFSAGAGANGAVNALALQSDGKVLMGGAFTAVNGQSRSGVARLNANGSLDSSFNPGAGANGVVNTIVVESDGRIVIGGAFTQYAGRACGNLARLNADGTIDEAFRLNIGLGANDTVSAVLEQPDGKLLVAGTFTTFGGYQNNRIIRLNHDGSVDASINFGTGANSFVTALAYQGYDSKVIVGGGFTQFNGEPRVALARVFGGNNLTPGTIQFATSAFSGSESALNIVVTVVRSGNSSGSATVVLTTSDGTAVAPVDYTQISSNLVFQPGEVVKTVNIPVRNDGVFNPGRSFNLSLRATDGTLLSSATASIVDNESQVAFTSSLYTVSEGAGFARITVTRTGDLTVPVSVDIFTASNGTATPYLDFIPVNATLIFNPGVNVLSFNLSIVNDNVSELPETVNLLLTNITDPAVLGSVSTATLNIVDNDLAPGILGFATNDFPVLEGDSGLTAWPITVVRTNGYSGSVSIHYSVTSGSALAGVDFVATNGNLVFNDGEYIKTFLVNVIGNTTLQGNRKASLQLSSPTGGATIGQGTASMTILDDDSAGSFEFAQPVFDVLEGQSNAVITVKRSGGSVGTATVTYMTTGGTAGAGQDYLAVSNTLSFGPGVTTLTFLVPIVDDQVVESVKMVEMVLLNPTGGALIGRQSSARLAITDNEVSIGFVFTGYTNVESGALVPILVSRTGNTNVPVSAHYFTSDGSAKAGVNYVATNGVVSFASGEMSKLVYVRLIDNTVAEPDKFLNLTLSGPTSQPGINALVGPVITAPLVILENDSVLSFGAATFTVVEGFTNVNIPVIRTGALNATNYVDVAITGGSAVPNVDYYVLGSDSLTFLPGQSSNAFVIYIVDNTIVDGTRTVNMLLRNASGLGATIGAQAGATLSILDNDSSVGFSKTQYYVNQKATNAVITLVRNGIATGTVSVAFFTANGTGVAGQDYFATSNNVTWLPGDMSPKRVTVPIIDYVRPDGFRTVNLGLIATSFGTVVAPAAATLFITDNAGFIAFSSTSYRAVEGSNAEITLVRTGGSNGVVSVDYLATPVSASSNDFLNPTGTIAFGDGETEKTFFIPIVADSLSEGIETVNLTLLNPDGGALVGNPASAVIKIADVNTFIDVAGQSLVFESLTPTNNTIDPGETVELMLALRNTGAIRTTSLVATLVPTNGISNVTIGQENYGALTPGGTSVSRKFRFAANGTNGSVLTLTLQLQDGTVNLGTVSFSFALGRANLVFANNDRIVINDFTNATPYPAAINVSGVGGLVSKLTVTLKGLSHGYPQDINVLLVSPTGQKVILMSDAGSRFSIDNLTVTFDDASANFMPQSGQIISGSYHPTNYVLADYFPDPLNPGTNIAGPYTTTLSSFYGFSPNGAWNLYVLDDNQMDSGLIAGGWSLAITTVDEINPTSDMEVGMTASPSPVRINGTLTYAIGVTNNGPAPASSVVLTVTLPNTNIVSVTGVISYGITNGQLIANLGNLDFGGVSLVSIQIKAPSVTGPISCIARVGAAQEDVLPENNQRTIKTQVLDIPVAPSIAQVIKRTTSIVFTWVPDGRTYVIESTPSLTSPVWTQESVTPSLITGYMTVTVPIITNSNRFYRLRLVAQ